MIENAIGGSGDDLFYSNSAANAFTGGAGFDVVSYARSATGVLVDLNARLTFDGAVNDSLTSIEGVEGSNFNDIFFSSANADTFRGLGGVDTVSYASSARAVTVNLPTGLSSDGVVNDVLSSIENVVGSAYNDVITGDAGANLLDGGPGGADVIDGMGGSDTVTYAGAGASVVVDLASQLTWDGQNNDRLSSVENAIGSAYNDLFISNSAANVFAGGAGVDTVNYGASASGVVIDLSSQASWDGQVGDSFSSIENAVGSAFNDVITGDAGANLLDGGQGGADSIDGRGGADTITYATSASAVMIDLAAQSTWDGTSKDTLASIENAIGSAYADTFVSSTGANAFDGGAGADTVSYAKSSTAVIVELSSHVSWDGAVNDTFVSIENVVGSAYNDVITGDAGANVLDGGPGGADSLGGGGGSDTVTYANATAGVIIDLASQLTWDGVNNDTLASVENAIGSAYADTFYSSDEANRFDGGAGADVVSYVSSARSVIVDFGAQISWDGRYNDTFTSVEGVVGSAYNDTIYSGAGADRIFGGGGFDTVAYSSSVGPVIVDLGAQLTWDGVVNDTLNSIENAIGSAYDDSLYGDGGANVLDGGAGGADLIYGGGGSDTVSYATSARAVIVDLGSQLTWDGVVNDTLNSIENAIGSSGNDTFYSSGGPNTMTGGGGDDLFLFRPGFGLDVVTDFTAGDGAHHDVLAFYDLGQNYSTLMSHAAQSGDNVVFTLGGSVLTLLNTTLGSLTPSDFIFSNA